jgi:predicted DNA-binding protein (UPF0251 family)
MGNQNSATDRTVVFEEDYPAGVRKLMCDIQTWKGQRMVGLRPFRYNRNGELVPDWKNGINLPESMIGAAIQGLQMAQERLRAEAGNSRGCSAIQTSSSRENQPVVVAGGSHLPKALQALRLHQNGLTYEQVAARLGVSRATAARYISEARATEVSSAVSVSVSVATEQENRTL